MDCFPVRRDCAEILAMYEPTGSQALARPEGEAGEGSCVPTTGQPVRVGVWDVFCVVGVAVSPWEVHGRMASAAFGILRPGTLLLG